MAAVLELQQKVVRWMLRRRGFQCSLRGQPGSRMHVYSWEGEGDGPDVVVVHGIATNAASFAPLLLRLRAKARRIWALDLPAHGFSEVPEPLPSLTEAFDTIAQVLDDLIHRPVVLIGASLGGAIALKYSVRSPGNVHRLALISPGGAPLSPGGLAEVTDRFHMERASDGRRFLSCLFHRRPWYGVLIGGQVVSLLNRPIVRRFFETISAQDMLTPEEAATLRPPTLIIWGKSEAILPTECLEWYRAHMPPNVSFQEPEGYGHSPHLEVPRDLTNRLTEFIDG